MQHAAQRSIFQQIDRYSALLTLFCVLKQLIRKKMRCYHYSG